MADSEVGRLLLADLEQQPVSAVAARVARLGLGSAGHRPQVLGIFKAEARADAFIATLASHGTAEVEVDEVEIASGEGISQTRRPEAQKSRPPAHPKPRHPVGISAKMMMRVRTTNQHPNAKEPKT